MTETTTDRKLSWTPPKASPFGLVVAGILDDIWALYNMRLSRVDFTQADIVEVNIDRSLSTFDVDHLTQLVVRSHDACVRLTICPCNMRYLKLQFHPRNVRVGSVWDRHPTMEAAVERVRSRTYFTRESVTPQEPTADPRNAEIVRLKLWVSELQSGQTVNCVYCGHCYGPRGETPVSMADVLTSHIEVCPDHPMSALKAEVARLTAENHELRELAADGKWSLEV